MLYANDPFNVDKFYDENTSVISYLGKRVKQHNRFYNSFMNEIMEEFYSRKDSRSMANVTEGDNRINCSDEDKFKGELCKPSAELREDYIRSLEESHVVDRVISGRINSDCYRCSLSFDCCTGINVYGDLSKVGGEWRARVKEEMDSKFVMNDVLNRKVYDISDMVYVSIYYGDVTGGSARARDTILDVSSPSKYIVEFDALLIRYAATLSEHDLELLGDTITTLITDKLMKLNINRAVLAKMLKTYVSFSEDSRKLAYMVENQRGAALPVISIFVALVITKCYSDSANGLASLDDNKTLEAVVNRAIISIQNSGNGQCLGNAANAIFSMIGRSRHTGRYLETYMDTIVNLVEQNKGDIISSCGHHGLAISKINPLVMFKKINPRIKYAGFECTDVTGISPIIDFGRTAEEVINKSRAERTIFGLESNSKLEEYKRKTRFELLGKLTPKERLRYNRFEADVTRYRSDAINAKDECKKNMLLNRSRSLGKIIAIEISKSKSSDVYVELLSALDDARFEIDATLASRDFNREKNTRLYGQVLPSGDWDY